MIIVNVFICNQSLLDWCASLAILVQAVTILAGVDGSINGVGGAIYCFLFMSEAVATPSIYGSVSCLVVITVERYVKVVHPVRHRKYFRGNCCQSHYANTNGIKYLLSM